MPDGIVGRGHALADVAAAVVGPIMLDPQIERPIAQGGRQHLERRIHVAERVAAGGRDFERIQHARLGRRGQVRHVGVPYGFSSAQATDRDAGFNDVRSPKRRENAIRS